MKDVRLRQMFMKIVFTGFYNELALAVIPVSSHIKYTLLRNESEHQGLTERNNDLTSKLVEPLLGSRSF